jgi:urease accessory protein
MRKAAPSIRCALLLAIGMPGVAEAHLGGGDGGLIDGLLHPVFGPDHLIAMVSVGVVSVQLGGVNIWRLPVAFVAAMTAGAALGIAQVPLPHTELGIAVSVVVLGLGILIAHERTSPWPIIGLVALFGACHGYAHGVEIPKSVGPALYSLGFVIGTAVLHIAGMAIGEIATLQHWLGRGLRLAGGLVAASGVLFVAQALAGG